jgi:7-cyano-7-deazaguanine synthase in queuosine biosynthesis
MSKILNKIGEYNLNKKKNEDLDVLNSLDKILIKKRGHVIKMPEKYTSVAVCMSGGLDSVANIFYLLKEYEYNIYPFFINHGQSAYNAEKKAVKYYDKIFDKQFPGLYHKTQEIKVATPGKEYKRMLRATKNIKEMQHEREISYPCRNSIMFLTGMEYAYSLESQGINIRNVFGAHMASDTSYHCSLTWTRLTNLTMCQITNNYDWQFIDVPIERELGNFFDKDVFIEYCHKNDFKIWNTRSCVGRHPIQCGDCPNCWYRRQIFKQMGIEDKTEYRFPLSDECPSYNKRR